jgi:hypothetical protein
MLFASHALFPLQRGADRAFQLKTKTNTNCLPRQHTGRVGSLDVLLERATTLFPGRGALRRLYRACDGRRIVDICEVADGEGYVVAKQEAFKDVPYATATLRHQVRNRHSLASVVNNECACACACGWVYGGATTTSSTTAELSALHERHCPSAFTVFTPSTDRRVQIWATVFHPPQLAMRTPFHPRPRSRAPLNNRNRRTSQCAHRSSLALTHARR